MFSPWHPLLIVTPSPAAPYPPPPSHVTPGVERGYVPFD